MLVYSEYSKTTQCENGLNLLKHSKFIHGLYCFPGNGRIKGGIGGIHVATPAQKVWRVSQALGDIAFAYPYSIILLEIEVTV